MGIESTGLDKLIKASYELLGLISFLTDGKKECRAWTIRKGTKAPQAAGKIHSDFERGFIRAQVIAYKDLEDADFNYAAVKAKGLQRTEGKEYVVNDGDVIEFCSTFNGGLTVIIGIMGAMPDEVDQLCARLENVTKENYAGVEYHCGTLQGKQVVVCCAGMGKANAASTVQVLCTKYGIDKLIFSGIAGNMTSKIGIGDVCVGETVVYHDAELSMIAQSAPFQTEYHAIPRWCRPRSTLHCLRREGHRGQDRPRATPSSARRDEKAIEEKCHPDCVEMEGAAVSQIAGRNGVPCVILRAMSDNADESGYEVLVVKQFSITEYVKTATEIVANMIESL